MGGISEVLISTFDIDRTCAPIIEVGGYRRLDLPDAPESLARAWRVPQGCKRIEQALLLPPTGERGSLRVVCFHGVERTLIRPSQRCWDTGGIFDIDVFSRDTKTTYRRLQRLGWSGFGEPVRYQLGDFKVTHVVATGPDGFVIGIIEPHYQLSFDLDFDAMSRAFNSTQIVNDMERALTFYRDTLGWTVLLDLVIDNAVEPGPDILGMPMPMAETARRRVAIVHPEGVNDGSVELLEIAGWEGRDHAANAVAPNVGMLALRIPIDSVDDYAEEIQERGGELYVLPCVANVAPYGELRTFSIRSPEGAILEFYEPSSADPFPA